MKRIVKTTIACLIILLCLDAIAVAQKIQEGERDPCINKGRSENEPCIATLYDKFKASTTVAFRFSLRANPDPRDERQNTLLIMFVTTETVLTRPEKVIFTFHTYEVGLSGLGIFERSKDVDFLIDGKPHHLGSVVLISTDNDFMGRESQSFGLAVPSEFIEEVASAKSIEMRAGNVEFKFTDDIKTAFRKFAELFPIKRKAEEKKDNQPQPPAKKPTPKKPATKTGRKN